MRSLGLVPHFFDRLSFFRSSGNLYLHGLFRFKHQQSTQRRGVVRIYFYQRIIYGVSVFLKFLLYFLFRFLLICLSIRVITGYLRRIWIGKGFIILAWFLKNIFWFFFDSTRSKSQQHNKKHTS